MAKENYMIGLTDAQKRATMCLDDIQDVCIKHKLNLTILDDGILDLWILKTIKLSWYGDRSTNRYRRKHHLRRNRPVAICPLSYSAVQRAVEDSWEAKRNTQSEERNGGRLICQVLN